MSLLDSIRSGSCAFVLATLAGAQECNPPSSGPDLIVGGLSGITRWGTVGGITGYSLGTDSCNVGDQDLAWSANTNQHPVIAQNIYRLDGGRFEQIGQSWLRHGFAPLNQSLCCACVDPGSSSLLGVGCSDPRSASLNGAQSGLGPRWEVDAHSGDFPFPFSTSGQTGDAIFKRLQVREDDLDPAAYPDAQYFAEGHYVTPHDAAAGNPLNNASYRPVAVGSASENGYALTFSGPTVRRRSAIYAWQAANPAVQLVELDVPGAGHLVVGALVTQVDAGMWRYEYAVYNMTLTRGVGAFRVPIGAGTNPSAIGFHGVESHSGDPYSSTPWSSQVAAGELIWSTDDFQTDPFANPIRRGPCTTSASRRTPVPSRPRPPWSSSSRAPPRWSRSRCRPRQIGAARSATA